MSSKTSPWENSEFVTFVADVRGMLWKTNGARNGVNWHKVAAKSGLCFATVSRFASDETKRPLGSTIFAIAQALDCKLQLVGPDGAVVRAGSLGHHYRGGVSKKG